MCNPSITDRLRMLVRKKMFKKKGQVELKKKFFKNYLSSIVK